MTRVGSLVTHAVVDRGGSPVSQPNPCQELTFSAEAAYLHLLQSLSTSETEFVAVSLTDQEAIYLRETLTDFGFSQTKATLLYEDNLACVAMSENPVRRKFSRHIDIRKYYVRELVLNGFLKLVPLRTHKMVADALTKSLPSLAFVGHRQIMTGHASFAARLLRCIGG